MNVIFIILLQNYEKGVHVHNYWFFWNGLNFNYFISTVMALIYFVRVKSKKTVNIIL